MSGGIANIDTDSNDFENSDVENDILSQAEDASGEKFGEDSEDDDEGQDEGQEEQQSDEEQQSSKQAASPRRKSREEYAQQRASREEVQKRIPTRRRVDYDYDPSTGDVVLPDGAVLYKNGTPEREMFVQLQDLRFKNSRYEQGLQEMASRGRQLEETVQRMQSVPSAGDALRLSIDDQVMAMQHMAAFRSNPVQAIRGMLHQYQVDGGDLSDIFDDIPRLQLEGLEARIGQKLDTASAPQRQEQERQQRQSEQAAALEREVLQLFDESPEAEIHADHLVHIINTSAQSGQRLSLQQAWTRLLRFANERGLDVRRSFGEQLAAQEQRGQRRQTALPRGNSASNLQRRSNGKPSHEQSSKDIVRDVMREAGIEV